MRYDWTVPSCVLVLLAIGFSTGLPAAEINDAEAPLPPEQAAATMRVPEGFRATLFAGEPDVMQPIGFCLDDRGRLWVAEAYNYPTHGDSPGDRIVILEDVDGDGQVDKRTVFYDQLNYVTGIEVGFGGAWVMSPPNMYFIADADGDDVPDREPEVLLDGFGNHANSHNLANGFAWGPDGWLYGTHGRTNWSLIGKPGTPDNQRQRFDGGVYRYHPIDHVWEAYADGTTNPWGIDWNDLGDAFITNCVNPHLFQVIQGAHYEPGRGRKSSEFAYQRIDTIADHLHFVGLGNVRNGLGSDAEDMAGGGHAHCGTMIYLGDNFPAPYRNQLFTNNIHGRRINNDLLRRSGSGYVASHGPDLMLSEDPWFMGVTLAYGPGGEVYVSDWSDTGECHSTRNTRKETGRIYRLTFLNTTIQPTDLRGLANSELVAYQSHNNDWFVRHARRMLQERFAAGDSMAEVHLALKSMFSEQSSVAKKLRALWALKVTGGASEEDLQAMLTSPHEEIRSWAVTLLCEDRDPGRLTMAQLETMAEKDRSPRVRLSLACALQRLPLSDRWSLAETLSRHGEDSDDQNLPLMYWYGIEPLVEDDLQRFASLAAEAAIPRLRINGARRIASSKRFAEGIEWLCRHLADEVSDAAKADLLAGMIVGLEGRRQVPMPVSWRSAYQHLQQSDHPHVRQRSIRLALTFADEQAIDSLKKSAVDPSLPPEVRQSAIAGLVASGQQGFEQTLLKLLDDAAVRELAIRGLARYASEKTPDSLVRIYAPLSAGEKQAAIETLASREAWAEKLLDAVESKQIPESDLTAFTVRQLSALDNDAITTRLRELWGEVRETPGDRSKKIASVARWLTADVIAAADIARGKALFNKHCLNCHRFFGEGGNIGPDLTGAQRKNIGYMLENIIDPSASVSHDYRMHKIATVDGRVITGLIESETEQSVNVLTANDRVVIPTEEIEKRVQSEVSIMPDELLDNLSEQEIRDLFGYLQR